MIKNKQAPHFWIKVDGRRRVSVYIEFIHANVKLDVLANYGFVKTRIGSVCSGDIVNLAYANVLGAKPFFAVVTEIKSELHSGFVKLYLDVIESKFQPPSE